MSPADVALDLLERMSVAGFVLDSSGRVLRFNSVAERCLEKHCTSSTRQVGNDSGWATKALRSLLGRGPTLARLMETPAAIQGESERPVLAHALSLTMPGQEPEAVLVLVDLETCPVSDEEMLRQVLGLTKAEAKLAVRLACGESLQDIAEAFGISLGTARMQLKAIFSKTCTCRQAELVALLCRLALLPRSGEIATRTATDADRA